MSEYKPRRTLVIEVDIQSALGDDRFFQKVAQAFDSGEADVVHFGVSRIARQSKRRSDGIDIGPLRASWKDAR